MISIGINYSQMHDSSACIARDGEVLFAVAEERLSRVKHDARFPALAIRACLDFAGIRADEVDFVCQGWPRPRAAYLHDLRCYATGRQPVNARALLNSTRQFRQHVPPARRRKSFPAPLRTIEGAVSLRGSPSRPRHQRLSLIPDLMMRPFSFSMAAAPGKPPRSGAAATDASNISGPFPGPIRSAFSTRSLLIFSASPRTATNGK